MVSSITQDPYSIIISLNLASSVNLNIGAPRRPTELAVSCPWLRFGAGSGPPPISSSRSHRAPRPTTARCPEQIQHINMQDAGRGRWQSRTPTERGESR